MDERGAQIIEWKVLIITREDGNGGFYQYCTKGDDNSLQVHLHDRPSYAYRFEDGVSARAFISLLRNAGSEAEIVMDSFYEILPDENWDIQQKLN